jgi:hypothetical protein
MVLGRKVCWATTCTIFILKNLILTERGQSTWVGAERDNDGSKTTDVLLLFPQHCLYKWHIIFPGAYEA